VSAASENVISKGRVAQMCAMAGLSRALLYGFRGEMMPSSFVATSVCMEMGLVYEPIRANTKEAMP